MTHLLLHTRTTPPIPNVLWLYDEAGTPWASTGTGGALSMTARSGQTIAVATAASTGLPGPGNVVSLTAGTTGMATPVTAIGESPSGTMRVRFMITTYTSFGTIFGKSYRNDGGWSNPWVSVMIAQNSPADGTFSVDVTLAASVTIFVQTTKLNIWQWCWVDMTYDAATGFLKAYYNGVLIGSTTLAGTHPIDWGTHGEWGSLGDGAGQALSGYLDQASWDSVVQTGPALLALYNAEAPAAPYSVTPYSFVASRSAATTSAGNFTIAVQLKLQTASLATTGAQFWWVGGLGAKTIRVSLWDRTSATRLAFQDIAVNAAGVYNAAWSITLTNQTHVYAVSMWDTSGAVFQNGAIASGPAGAYPVKPGGVLVAMTHLSFGAGDANPTSDDAFSSLRTCLVDLL